MAGPDEDTPPTPGADDTAPADPKAMWRGAFSAAAATYDTVIDFFGPFGRALVAAADPAPGARVLDLACGRGACLRPALDAVGPAGHVTGVDLAPAMVTALQADLDAVATTNASVVIGDAEELEFPDAAFDVVLGGFMIFFAPDPHRVLAEVHRVLRPGGTVALSVFDGPSGFPWMRDLTEELVGAPPPRPGDDFIRTAVLEAALAVAGFDVGESTGVRERFVFADVDTVVRWLASHGGRMLLDHLDDDGRARLRVLLAERLDAGHRVDGGYELVQEARISVATRRR